MSGPPGEAFGADSLAAALDGRYEHFESLEARAGTLIYRARQRSTGRRVVVKLLMNERAPADAPPPEEVRALAELSWHSNVVTLIEAGTTPDGIPFLVTDFVSGGTLADIRPEEGDATAVDRILDAVAQVASALGAAHRLGVIHCDVKPSNIWLASDGSARLGDFGIARMLEHTAPTLDDVRGTIHFVAPEVLDGGQPTAAADVFSLGRTIGSVIEGDGTARNDSFLTAVARDMQSGATTFPRLRTHLAHDPRTLALLESTIDPDPTRRPTATDVADALRERPRTGLPVTLARSWRPTGPTLRKVAMVAVGIMLVATGLLVRNGEDDTSAETVATVAELCTSAADMVRASNEFIDSLPARLDETESTYDLLDYLLREVPQQLAQRAQPLIDTARRLGSTRRDAEQLSAGSLERLVLADGIYNVARGKFLIGPHAEVDNATVPAIVRPQALAWESMSRLAREQCDSLPAETTQKETVGSMLRERLGFNDPDTNSLADLFGEERSYDLFDDQFVILMLELAPDFVLDLYTRNTEWVTELFERQHGLRDLFTSQSPELLLQVARQEPALVDVIQSNGDWLHHLRETLDGLGALRRQSAERLYREQFDGLGIPLRYEK